MTVRFQLLKFYNIFVEHMTLVITSRKGDFFHQKQESQDFNAVYDLGLPRDTFT